jgi:hypothetical protein
MSQKKTDTQDLIDKRMEASDDSKISKSDNVKEVPMDVLENVIIALKSSFVS